MLPLSRARCYGCVGRGCTWSAGLIRWLLMAVVVDSVACLSQVRPTPQSFLGDETSCCQQHLPQHQQQQVAFKCSVQCWCTSATSRIQEMEAAPADAADAAGESSFLRCVTLLNDDVLTAYLLPKLVEQGSAGAVAATCSQLRKLCQHSAQHLNLAKQLQDANNPCLSPGLACHLVAAFPNCSSLECAWDSSSLLEVYHSIRMLAGLQHLSTISISLDNHNEDGDLDPVLSQLHMHATGLRCLKLQLEVYWEHHQSTWESLGKMVSLARLELTFCDQVERPCVHVNLRSLSGLTNLQSLIITADGALWDGPDPAPYVDDSYDDDTLQQFPGPLKSLTQLWLPLDVLPVSSSFSECVRLQDLQLLSSNGVPRLTAVGWAALARLTSLTCLHIDVEFEDELTLDDEVVPSGAEAFYGVLRQLPALQAVGSYTWTLGSLSVLQRLTHLTAVYGSWHLGGAADLRGLACPHIRMLSNVTDIPAMAFPNLVCVEFGMLSTRDVSALSCHCTGLQKLVLLYSWCRLYNGDVTERISAYRSMARMQHLTHLDLAPENDTELLAFTSAAAAVRNPQLRCLHVWGKVTLFALMQLQSVRGLTELLVRVSDSQAVWESFILEPVRMWLVGLALVPKVCLELPSADQHSVIDVARRWAAQLEMPLPAVLKVSLA